MPNELPQDITFRFSSVAVAKIRELIAVANARDPKDLVSAVGVGWGDITYNDGRTGESLAIGFYTTSQMNAGLRALVQPVDGLDVIFWVLPEKQSLFRDKVIDFEDRRWFFLR